MSMFRNIVRDSLLRSPLRHLYYYRYQYNFTPKQLAYFCGVLTNLRQVPGAIVEIGCAQGATTVFLNKHLQDERIDRNYYAIDTFGGFTKDDIAYETSQRGKEAWMFTGGFRNNSKARFDSTMKFNSISNVTSYQADIGSFNIADLGAIAFCLLDVDLYRPTVTALPDLYHQLSPGGLIVVDDCMAGNPYDGSLQAYMEFCNSIDRPVEIVLDKLGLIVK